MLLDMELFGISQKSGWIKLLLNIEKKVKRSHLPSYP